MDLPELAEREATGETAAIYAEIRRLGGVPMVALIFRHLAAFPGGIAWAWRALAPAWRSGRLQEAAWRIAREASLEPLAPMPRAALASLGVDRNGEREIRIVLGAYNRANPENLLSVLCLLRLFEGCTASAAAESRVWTPPPAAGPLAPMTDVSSMPAGISALLALVAAPGKGGEPRVVQSLYRHFVHRPGFLALAITLLLPRFRDGSIDRTVASLHATMGATADDLVQSLSAPAAPEPRMRPALERFGGGVIAQMIAVGRLLEDALPVD